MAASASYNEVAALLARHEGEERDPQDTEMDLRRLLLLSRDRRQREALVRAQGVRRLLLLSRASSSVGPKRFVAGILANLAQSEKARLSGSSCDRWQCVAHRHQCPLFSLLDASRSHSDRVLRQLSAAALLSFSVQRECQLQLLVVGALPVLLRLLEDCDDATLVSLAAATLWNAVKSPRVLLRLETSHAVLRAALLRRLTALLRTPLLPFELTVSADTGQLDSGGANQRLLLAATVSTELTLLLRVESDDSVGAEDPGMLAPGPGPGRGSKADATGNGGQSGAQFDERGMLVARSCAACGRAIRVGQRRLRGSFLTCARDGCEQTYHVACSRWRSLAAEDVKEEEEEESGGGSADAGVRCPSLPPPPAMKPTLFRCDACVQQWTTVLFCDFVADHAAHALLLTESGLASVAIQRVAPVSRDNEAENNDEEEQDDTQGEAADGLAASRQRHRAMPPLSRPHQPQPPGQAAVFAVMRNYGGEVVALGEKRFRVPASSQDREMFVVAVRFLLADAAPATYQRRLTPSSSSSPVRLTNDWPSPSYARPQAMAVPVAPGQVVWWPGAPFLVDTRDRICVQRSLPELEHALIFEFVGTCPTDRVFAFGGQLEHEQETDGKLKKAGLWSPLFPRRGVCMKILAEQIGHHKQRAALLSSTAQRSEEDRSSSSSNNSNNSNKTISNSTTTPKTGGHRRLSKPRFRRLNKVASAATAPTLSIPPSASVSVPAPASPSSSGAGALVIAIAPVSTTTTTAAVTPACRATSSSIA